MTAKMALAFLLLYVKHTSVLYLALGIALSPTHHQCFGFFCAADGMLSAVVGQWPRCLRTPMSIHTTLQHPHSLHQRYNVYGLELQCYSRSAAHTRLAFCLRKEQVTEGLRIGVQ